MNARKGCAIAAFCAALLLGLALATQRYAAYVEYDPLLGAPLFAIGTLPIYPPWRFCTWYADFGDVTPQLFDAAFLWLYTELAVSLGLLTLLLRRKKPPASHGSARWGDTKDAIKAGVLTKKGRTKAAGVILGKWKDEYLRHDGPEHVMLMAPTRSWKGISSVMPTCLSWHGSLIITDIKGECWHYCAAFRQKAFQNICLKFMPTDERGQSAHYNPFDEIRIGTKKEVADAQNIVTIIVDPQGKGDLSHWQLSASSLFLGVILHLKYAYPERASLGGLARFMSRPKQKILVDGDLQEVSGIELILQEMLQTEHLAHFEDQDLFRRLYNLPDDGDKLNHPVVRDIAAEMLNKDYRELSGVISTAISLLGLYRDPVIASNTDTSDFCVADLMNQEKPVSLFLVNPPSDIDRVNPLFRLIIELMIRRNIEEMRFDEAKKRRPSLVAALAASAIRRSVKPLHAWQAQKSQKTAPKPKRHKLLLLLDEFPALGRLDALEREFAYIAGYGVKAFMITQSLNQLKKTYTENNSILDNCHIRMFFAPNEPDSAQYIARLLGKYTEHVALESKDKWRYFSGTQSETYVARDLMTPEEIMQLDIRFGLLFAAGVAPLKIKKIQHYLDPVFKPRMLPPLQKSDVILQPDDNPVHKAILQAREKAIAEAEANPANSLPPIAATQPVEPPAEEPDQTAPLMLSSEDDTTDTEAIFASLDALLGDGEADDDEHI